MLFRTLIRVKTARDTATDVTDAIHDALSECVIKEGTCHLYLPATTACLALNENDTLLLRDFLSFAKTLAREEAMYAHPENAHSHLRAAVFGQDKTIPFSDGRLVLGQWQRVLLWEFDTHSRERELVISVSGD